MTGEDLKRLTEEPRYTEGELLGRGGMGEVRLCHDRRIGRDVARKTIRAEHHESGEVALRMLREAVLQGQLDHPAVVPVYDLGLGDDGLFFTMKRVRGVSLAEALSELAAGAAEAQQRYPMGRLLSAFETVCLAVDFAHSRGVLHRDLKPGNIMLGDFGEVYVLDWGVAKVLDQDETAESWERRQLSVPHGGAMMGTPGYMSPEQIRGDAEVDARTDVYALGAILFELLTHERAHRGDAMARMQSTLLGVDAPSSRRPGIAPELDAICQRALAVDPSERFPSARALADAVTQQREAAKGQAMRERLAEQAAQRSTEAAGDGASTEAQVVALREAANALLLQPDNAQAALLLARLLDRTPDALPPEAARAFAEETQRRTLSALSFSALRFVLCGTVTLLLLVSPGGSPLWRALTYAAAALAAGATLLWRVRDGDRPQSWTATLSFALMLALLVLSSGLFGPFVIVPLMLLLLGMAMIFTGFGRRPLVVGGCVLASVLPHALSLAGWLPAVVPAGAALLPLGAAPLVLLRALLVGAPLVLWGRLHDRQMEAERRLFWQAWQLRQLGAQGPATPRSP